ncbi:MAG: hypothetical protein Q9M31_00625 [Mariprofundus sp.]|nr:hypothetical protein [Mariprofundus sp.]
MNARRGLGYGGFSAFATTHGVMHVALQVDAAGNEWVGLAVWVGVLL